MNKVCTKCSKNKPLEDYYKDARVKDGRASECKSCRIVVQINYNKSDEGKLTRIKYNKSDKGKATRVKVNAKYLKTDRGKAMIARKNHNRNISISNTLCTLSDKEFNYIVFTAQKNKCACCGKTFNKELMPTRDHIIPVDKGGDFTIYTVQALCQECNSRKGIKYIDYRTDHHKNIISNIFV